MSLEHGRLVRFRRSAGAGVVADDVDTRRHPATQERLRAVDAGVEERDCHTAPVDVRKPAVGWVADSRTEVAESFARDARGISCAHGIDARNLRRTLQERESVRVERGREAVDDTRVAVLRLDGDAFHPEARDEELLRSARRAS